MVDAGNTEWQASHYFIYQHIFNAAVLCTTSVLSFFYFPQTKQEIERDIIKLKPLGSSEMQNM